MSSLVVHFEIHASEPQRLIDFYSALLGWRFEQFGQWRYWSISTGEGSIGMDGPGMGINGGLTEREGPAPETGAPINGSTIVVAVDDVDASFARGLELGGAEAIAPDDLRGRRPGRLPARPGRERLRHDLGGALRRHGRAGADGAGRLDPAGSRATRRPRSGTRG